MYIEIYRITDSGSLNPIHQEHVPVMSQRLELTSSDIKNINTDQTQPSICKFTVSPQKTVRSCTSDQVTVKLHSERLRE